MYSLLNDLGLDLAQGIKIFTPAKVSVDDPVWSDVMSLLKVYPLETRTTLIFPENRIEGIVFADLPAEFCRRINRAGADGESTSVHREFRLDLPDLCTVYGSFPESDEEQAELFNRTVGDALKSELTIAEQRRWQSSIDQFVAYAHYRKEPTEENKLKALAEEAAQIRFKDLARSNLELAKSAFAKASEDAGGTVEQITLESILGFLVKLGEASSSSEKDHQPLDALRPR